MQQNSGLCFSEGDYKPVYSLCEWQTMVKADGMVASTSWLDNWGGWYPYTVCKGVNPERWKGVVSVQTIFFAHDVGYWEE